MQGVAPCGGPGFLDWLSTRHPRNFPALAPIPSTPNSDGPPHRQASDSCPGNRGLPAAGLDARTGIQDAVRGDHVLPGLCGWIGTTGGWVRTAWAQLLALASVDSARRAWLLPDLALSTPRTLSFSEWRQLHAENSPHSGGNIWEILAKVAGDRFIVVDSPGTHVGVTAAGGHATPFESPRFAPALDPSLSVEEAMGRLRAAHIRFVMFSVRNPVINKFIQRHPTLRRLASDYEPVANLHGLMIFDLEFLSRKQAAPAATKPAG